MLVAIAIGAIIIIVSSQFMSTSNTVSSTSVTTSASVRSVQQTEDLIADDVRKATGILPAGTAVSIAGTIGAPSTTGSSMLAMVVPTTSFCGSFQKFEYVLYYFTDRSNISVANDTSATEWTYLYRDTTNDTKKVLVQLRADTCNFKPAGATLTSTPVLRLIADYISTGSFTLSSTGGRQVLISMQTTQTVQGKSIIGPLVTTTAISRNMTNY